MLNILIGVMALSHFLFLVLEMFFWARPLGLKVFGQSLEKAKASQVLAANQGLYNGFLSAGLIWSLLHPMAETAWQLKVFFSTCVLAAGLYGAWTVSFKIFWVQSLPALFALALLFFL